MDERWVSGSGEDPRDRGAEVATEISGMSRTRPEAVVIGVTDSHAARIACERAATIAGRDGTLILVTATGKLRTNGHTPKPFSDQSTGTALGSESHLATRGYQVGAVLRDLREHGCRLGVRNVLTCHGEGNPAHVIAQVASQHQCRFVVIGESSTFPKMLARKLDSLIKAELLIARRDGQLVRYRPPRIQLGLVPFRSRRRSKTILNGPQCARPAPATAW
ncbi:Universal stress protein family [Mycobacteroides abscessus subsp. bolletii]|uniref:universal stress protein n=2 Tax=Mycobacteroides abscessus TaxID=36809 RepID=UPI0009A795D9|nr:universal stress protein [Mycobacteroides abscessus]SKF99691.1 Universal stress protein family [Mycobacteroides abscessus subsp. bolletii]SKG35375.1 Universal stress protein family [Mycobacteroides abscessus subsp. bolletii]